MNSLIVCGYSGIGKTEFAKTHFDAIDIDSATIRRGTNFEQEYLDSILQSIGKYRYILVSTHSGLRDELAKLKKPVVLIYPERKLKHEYLMRYLMRGNSYIYTRHIGEIWDRCIVELEEDKRFPAIVLSKGQFLSECMLDSYF